MEKPAVLLVDDNEATCTLLTALLCREFAVQVAHDGREAVETLRDRTYRAILLDVRMPQLDGFGVLEFLAAHRPYLLPQTIVLTASLSTDSLARLRNYPIGSLVTKPFEIETLLAAVRDAADASPSPSARSPFLPPN